MITSNLSDEVYIDLVKENIHRAVQNLNSILAGDSILKELLYELFTSAGQTLIKKREKSSKEA